MSYGSRLLEAEALLREIDDALNNSGWADHFPEEVTKIRKFLGREVYPALQAPRSR